MNKNKKSTFKNPFDLDQEDEDQIPIQSSYVSYESEPHTVHNPLPFNPYEIQKENNKKQSKNSSSSVQKQPKIVKSQPKKIEPVHIPPSSNHEPKPQKSFELNQDGDPPLLQDIGIDPELIFQRMKLVLRLKKPDQQTLDDPDLSGPILIALCFGFLLLLSGKIHFGDIYAIFVIGNVLLYFLFNFMSQVDLIPLYNIMSTVGYALMPMLILGACGIFTSLKGTSGILLSLAVSGWASLSASNFIECLMKQTQADRKPLLIYPLFLFYVSFAMIIIF